MINHVERPLGNLTAAHLLYGKVEHPSFKTFGSSYFIDEHTEDAEFISKQIRQLYVAGCRSFGFYGGKRDVWHKESDVELVLLHPPNCDACPVIYEYKIVDELVNDIYEDISVRAFVSFENYLFYDDRNVYEEVIQKLMVYNNEA